MKLYLVESGYDLNFVKKIPKDIFIIRIADIILEHNFDIENLTHIQSFIVQEDIKSRLKKLNNLKKCDSVYLFVDKIQQTFIKFIKSYIVEAKINVTEFDIYMLGDM